MSITGGRREFTFGSRVACCSCFRECLYGWESRQRLFDCCCVVMPEEERECVELMDVLWENHLFHEVMKFLNNYNFLSIESR